MCDNASKHEQQSSKKYCEWILQGSPEQEAAPEQSPRHVKLRLFCFPQVSNARV